MNNSDQPEKEIPVRSQLESQLNAHIPTFEDEDSEGNPRHSNDEVVNKAINEPVQVFLVDKKVLKSAGIGLSQEASVWDVYNHEAKKADDELAAIFAAVLTGFITESKKMLEQDQTELLVNVAIFGINNMGNTSNLPFAPPTFVPTSTAISINCFLFSSLGTSLMAALAAVVSLQWIADYDAAITRGGSSPADRARRRQFRFAGVINWKMDEIIASLPLLLYSSVALFWIGAMQWMYKLHSTVGSIVAGGTAMAVLFYVSTTLIAAVYVSAPFKTPLSRGIYRAYQSAVYLVHELLSAFLQKPMVSRTRNVRFSAKFAIVEAARIVVIAIILLVQAPFLVVTTIMSWLDERGYLQTIRDYLPQWVKNTGQLSKKLLSWATSQHTRLTSRQREDRAADWDQSLTQQALTWLADQLTSSANSNVRLQLLVDEVVKQSSKATSSGGSSDASWLKIFDSLAWHYLRKILDGTLSENDHETVGFLVRRSRTRDIWDRIEENDSTQPHEWYRYSFNTTKVTRSQAMESVNMAFLLARDVPIPSPGSDHELRFTIRLIKWRNSGVREKEYPHSGHYSAEYLKSYVLYLKSFLRFADSRHYQLDDYIPLWSLANDEEVRHELMVELLEHFDELLVEDPFIMKNSCLFGIIINDIVRSYDRWPSSLDWSEAHHQRLGRTQDPCIALLGNFAAGVPVHRGIALSIDTYADSLGPSLFQNLSSNDPPILWHLRALL
ncbi:hypothetical protein M408DRAFT_30178 [Serendipita vermifera MAFF 305830]|uniref:DUF6535 domain-containing protein n=1 Tax=Serendipita vermifera MAFF 305830 TaxID=933852 RepID=A0A0C2WT04_SERVB|nr:hypothetical protein M408DRAFT_30178 [Serendipita vermifera MAFF 305830]